MHLLSTLRVILVVAFSLSAVFGAAVPARAAGQVGSGTPQSCTEAALRNALSGGGDITFNCGPNPVTITLTTPLTIAQNASIDGGGPALGGNVTISGGNRVSVLRINSNLTVSIRNLTISNGRDPGVEQANRFGGVFINSSATVSIINSRFVDNDGNPAAIERAAGAILARPGVNLTVLDSEFVGNRGVNGGAIHMLLSTLVVENSTFIDNTAVVFPQNAAVTGLGGAIYVDGASTQGGAPGQIVIRGSSFDRNTAQNQGGGAFTYGYDGDSLLVEQSSFTNNVAGMPTRFGIGGGLRFGNHDFLIRDTTFSGNTSYGNGGAVWGGKASPGEFINATFAANRAMPLSGSDSAGGALYITEGTYRIINSTITGNSAGITGGALIGGSETIAIQNTLLAGNTSPDNRPCRGVFSGANNLQWPASTSVSGTCISGISFADPLLQPLGANGGPTQTSALGAGSPAINAGNTGLCPETDQRGADRVGTCDIGAFEHGSAAPTSPMPNTPSLSQVINRGSPIVLLTWGRVSRTTYYEVEITATGQSGAAATPPPYRTSTNSAAFGLDRGDYQARVRACNASGCSDYTTVQAFSVTSDPERRYLAFIDRP